MKCITGFCLFLFAFISNAQSNLTVFNNDGRQFYVILNGIKQNAVPKTNVFIGNIKNGSYSTKIIFSDGSTPDIDKNFFIDSPSDITTRIIFKNGVGKLQLIGMEPTQGELHEATAVQYRSNDAAVFTDNVATNQTTTTTTTTTTNSTSTSNSSAQPAAGNGGVNMNVGVNASNTGQQPNNTGATGMNMNVSVTDPADMGGGINMNVNINGMGMENTQSQMNATNNTVSNTSTTVTTTTTTTASPTSTPSSNVSSNSTSTRSCKNILGDVDAFVRDINDLSFDADRKEAIMGDLATHCLTANQAYKIVETLSFEADRLDVSKYLFDRMIDKDKGNSLLTLFTFDSSKMEYREHMRKAKQ